VSSAGGERRCAHFRASGRVQGVFYRAATQEKARQLGVTGWVRNCADGEVELVACGTPAQLDALEQWLWQGPPSARVNGVRRRETPLQAFDDFTVRR
jgi:acylphosphatase